MEIISIEEEFKRNPELRQEDLDHLKQWINQEKCVPASIPDLQLALFLHCCDYSLGATKDLMKINYRWRAEQSDYFINRNLKLSPQLQRSLYVNTVLILPQRSSANELIVVIRIIDNDPKTFYFLELTKLFFMFMDVYLLYHGTSNGLVILYDCEPVTFALARKINISSLRVLFFYLQEAIPFKVNAIHFLNSHRAFDLVYTIMKPFINGSLMSKMHFHKAGSTSIFSHLEPVSVPKLFNGKEESSLVQLHEQSLELLQSFEPWFEREENTLKNFMLTQNQKLNKCRENDNLSEASAHFGKLEID